MGRLVVEALRDPGGLLDRDEGGRVSEQDEDGGVRRQQW